LGLLADAAVNPLAEQVGVAEVAGVLLDHVEYHLAQRGGGAILHGGADGEVWRPGDELLREGDLLVPARQASATTAGSATAPAQSASSTSSDQYSGGSSA
jgi:hypothetical protein